MNCESTLVDILFIQGLEWNSLEKAEAQSKRNLFWIIYSMNRYKEKNF